MDTERNLLFGVVALQSGAVDVDHLVEATTAWVTKPTLPLADLFVNRGLMTDEQKTEVEAVVAHELEVHGGNPQATLAASLDGRSLEAIREATGSDSQLKAKLNLPSGPQGDHLVLGTLSPSEVESRERYTLMHLHAKGGMGRVWLARDAALGRQVAIKELRPDQACNSIIFSRFLYEAKITAQLEHPGIVPIYELGEGTVPYYTMRFLRGHTLSETARTYHKMRARGEASSIGMMELLSAFVGVCHAVAYAHSRGIIHRDLKGQNVVLGDFGEVMVLDWGLAKRIRQDPQGVGQDQASSGTSLAKPLADLGQGTVGIGALDLNEIDDVSRAPSHNPHSGRVSSDGPDDGSKLQVNPSSNGDANHPRRGGSASSHQPQRESGAGPTGTIQGQLLGTPSYMAPEQAQGRHNVVDERSDVYGLGAILYEVLTGRPPFTASKSSEIVRKVCQEAITPPRQIIATTAPALEAICLRALQKAPEARYGSAAELAQEVQRWQADEPVLAYAAPWFSRVLRWARRHRTIVSTAAGLLLAASIFLSVGFALVTRERNEAEAQGRQARHAVHMLAKVAEIGFDDQLDPLQKEFLGGALSYYEQFTSRVADDPAVRQEHGRVYQQMGDIQRKLGRLSESRQAYLKAIEVLQPLVHNSRAGPETEQVLARTRTLLGDLLVRSGADKEQSQALYRQALATQETLASAPAATTDDQLRLGQTLKSQGDLFRLDGQLAQAGMIYDKALTVLARAHAVDPKQSEVRNELAMVTDARGWVYRDLGDVKKAEQAYQHAVTLLEDLVKEFPTVPRHRESLARAYNSLGLIEASTGRLADAEIHLRGELPLAERLAQDFGDRPEYQRVLARTLMNLGNLLSSQNRVNDAEPILRRAIDVNSAITAKDSQDVQIRLDLARCHNNLGEFLRQHGDPNQAVASFLKARSINEALVKAFPDKPRYRAVLASCLANLALVWVVVDPAKLEETYHAAISIYEKLVTDYPDNVGYRLELASCLQNQGSVLANQGKPEQAEAIYKKALAMLETQETSAQSSKSLRVQAGLLNNLGELDLPGAEAAYRRSISLSQKLMDREQPNWSDRHTLAIAQNNLGQSLVDQKRLPEAGAMFAQAVSNFEKLVAERPRAIDLQSQIGIVLGLQGKWLDLIGNTGGSKTALASAVEHQRQAVQLSKNGSMYRELLGGHLLELAWINLKLGLYDDAAHIAIDLPKTVPSSSRANGCFNAARILARLVAQVSGDGKLKQAERTPLTQNFLGHTIMFLREAIDTNPKLASQVKTDPDIKVLQARADFQTMMNTLIDVQK
jgi:serine/threonine protein kinase